MANVKRELISLFKLSLKTSLNLFKVMVPVIIIVRILSEYNLIVEISRPLGPLMELVGLPAKCGLIWGMTMMNNIYGGIIVFSSIDVGTLTVAQTSVLAIMMLIAHSLPVEIAIAGRLGARMLFNFLLRFVGSFVFAFILNSLYSHFHLFQDVAVPILEKSLAKKDLQTWALGEMSKLLMIFILIYSLFILISILKKIKVISIINHLLTPLMRLVGINESSSLLAVIGLILGLTYGSGLIMEEVDSGRVSKKDAFFLICFMGYCHALVEDTFLVLLMGAEIFGVLIFRVLIGFSLLYLLMVFSRLSNSRLQNKFLWKS